LDPEVAAIWIWESSLLAFNSLLTKIKFHVNLESYKHFNCILFVT